jgi:type I restriction enzyme S subunit
VFGSNGPVGWTTEALANGPGIILGRKGAYRGVEFSREPFFVIDTAYYVVPKSDLDMRWVYYAIKHHKLGEIDDGSPIPSTTRSAVYVRDLEVPPLAEQQRIAHILGTLDDKIELNRRMNETLKAMARALFQSWFVNFDPVRAKQQGRQPPGLDAATAALFPAEFEATTLGRIPIGWKTTRLKELTSKIGSGATPRGGSAVYVEDGVSLIRSQNVHDHDFRWNGLVRLSEKSAAELRGVEVRCDDILFNITGDSILRTCVVDPMVLPARVNQHVAIIRAANQVFARYLHLTLVQESMKLSLSGLSAGATRQAVTKGHLEEIEILEPPLPVVAAFHETTRPIFSAIENNRVQSRTLAALRDALLPKLLSGALRVNKAECAVEADALAK